LSIENPKEYVKNLWDWKILDGCFGNTNIKVSDLDGFVERKGKTLFIETKAPTVVKIKDGQQIAFDAWVKNGMTVFVVWGYPGNPIKVRIWPKNEMECDLQKLRDLVSRWYYWADTGNKKQI